MSRLVNLGPGDLSDRLTILALKIHYGKEAGRDVKHFETERTTLLSQIRSRTLNGKWFDQVLDLAAVNAALWQAMEHLQRRGDVLETEKDEAERERHFLEAGRLGLQILRWNDRRAQLIEEINRATGDHLGEEKIVSKPKQLPVEEKP